MPSKSKDRKITDETHRNSSPNVGLNTDMLTEQELQEAGFKIKAERHNNACSHAPKCSECGRKVKSPVTSYIKGGYDVVEEGELLHENCARARHEAIIAYLTSLTQTGE